MAWNVLVGIYICRFETRRRAHQSRRSTFPSTKGMDAKPTPPTQWDKIYMSARPTISAQSGRVFIQLNSSYSSTRALYGLYTPLNLTVLTRAHPDPHHITYPPPRSLGKLRFESCQSSVPLALPCPSPPEIYLSGLFCFIIKPHAFSGTSTHTIPTFPGGLYTVAPASRRRPAARAAARGTPAPRPAVSACGARSSVLYTAPPGLT